MLESFSPDFSITEEMEGKQIFLFGGYERDRAAGDLKLLSLKLQAKKLKVYTYLPKVTSTNDGVELRWHAKLAVFLSEGEPVLAVTGSSNFTGPSMYGPSEEHFYAGKTKIQVEADTYFWKKGNLDAGQTMHDALHYWGNRTSKNIAFDDARYDDEIGKLIEHIYQSILLAEWDRLY
jgi:hypothetical protein